MSLQKSKGKKERNNFQIRVSEEEKALIIKNARAAGMTMTDFAKYSMIHKQPSKKIATPLRQTMIKISAELGKVRSNLIQINHVMRDKEFYSDNVKSLVIQTSVDIGTLSDEILNLLQQGIPEENNTMDALPQLYEALRKFGTYCNQIAKTMNDKSYFSVTIKESVIIQVMNGMQPVSSQILNIVQNGNEGKNQGERRATGNLPPDESG